MSEANVDDGVSQLWQTGGNSLKLRNVPLPEEFRLYMEYKDAANNRIICTIKSDGRVIQEGIDITDNDSALAECFIKYLAMQGVKVNRGS